MTASKPNAATLRRVTPNQFAHLRAIAEGLSMEASAQRYLGVNPGTDPLPAHHKTLRMVTALAHFAGHAKFAKTVGKHYLPTVQVRDHNREVSFEQFLLDHPELEDFSETEKLEIYKDRYPDPEAPDSALLTKKQWADRMRIVQTKFLRHLEMRQASIRAETQQLVEFWFPEHIAKRLVGAGLVNLGDLAKAIAAGLSWNRRIAGIGKEKAQKIAAMLDELLPGATKQLSASRQFTPALSSVLLSMPQLEACLPPQQASQALIYAANDLEAVQSWLDSHTASENTRKSFWRIARTFMLWLKLEKFDLPLRQLRVEDCRDFMAFLDDIPPQWISRQKVPVGEKGWAPFRGQLTPSSRQNYIDVLSGLFSYLTLAKYLSANPWKLVNTRIERKKKATVRLTSKAIPSEALARLETFIRNCPDSAGKHRALFVLVFMSATGLRVSELLHARIADVRQHDTGHHAMEVIGKGGKPRVVVIPEIAVNALNEYLLARGFENISVAPKSLPLVASALSPTEGATYISLHKSMRSWITKAMRDKTMDEMDKATLHAITIHWLRHTFATAAVEKDVPYSLIQAQLGHSTIQTTIDIYGKAPLLQQLHVISSAFKAPAQPQV